MLQEAAETEDHVNNLEFKCELFGEGSCVETWYEFNVAGAKPNTNNQREGATSKGTSAISYSLIGVSVKLVWVQSWRTILQLNHWRRRVYIVFISSLSLRYVQGHLAIWACARVDRTINIFASCENSKMSSEDSSQYAKGNDTRKNVVIIGAGAAGMVCRKPSEKHKLISDSNSPVLLLLLSIQTNIKSPSLSACLYVVDRQHPSRWTKTNTELIGWMMVSREDP